MDYIVVEDDSLTALTGKVNDQILQGMIPIGGICATSRDGVYPLFYQAMISKRVTNG
jgi:hypothetical protein